MIVCTLPVFLGFRVKVTWMKHRPKGNQEKLYSNHQEREILVVTQCKAWVFGRSLDETAGLNTDKDIDVCLL